MTRRMSEDGYVFLRNFLDRETVNAVLDDFIRILKAHGYVVPGATTSPVWSGKEQKGEDFSPLPPRGAVIRAVASLESLRKLYTSKELLDVLGTLFGGEAYSMGENDDRLRAVPPTKAEVLRKYAKNPAGTSFASHQDHETLRYPDGSAFPFYTVWVPVMKITEDVGGLFLVKGSHKSGFYKHYTLKGEDMGAPIDQAELRRWVRLGAIPASGNSEPAQGKKTLLRSDYIPGDVIIFQPQMLHRGLPNSSKVFRLSADFRYAKRGAPKIWRADKKIEYIYAYYQELDLGLKKLKIDPSMASTIRNRLFVEGPARTKGKTLRRRIEGARKSLKSMTPT
ncbi:MAG: phytanoyl-CoA dioxygenase family protein [Thaumarchaeota archaeon]|nr:phytanoyl-CoA dioxygenase family protein [Nitrososphaerota archaeon]